MAGTEKRPGSPDRLQETLLKEPVPARAIVLCIAALAVPVLANVWSGPVVPEAYEPLLWLLALVPAFLLAYYRGWGGVAVALAAGMAVLAGTAAFVAWSGDPLANWPLVLLVTAAFVLISLAVGFVTDQLHQQRAEAEWLALSDPLTQLPNRRAAEFLLDREFAAATRKVRPLTVVLWDLDRFKQVNDEYGHAAADTVLVAFARVLERYTRAMNLSARYGGEEFISVLGGSDEIGAARFAEKVRAAVEASCKPAPDATVTVSGGIAQFNEKLHSTWSELVSAADEALYTAKRGGRNQVALWRPDPSLLPEPESAPMPTRAPRTVLIIEDERGVRRVVRRVLERAGFATIEAESGPAALALLEGHDGRMEAAIIDLMLPEMLGTEVYRHLQRRQPGLPVLFISGYTMNRPTIEDGRAMLQKPFEPKELLTAVEAVIKGRPVG